jgi:hypothetical protein
MFSEKPNRLSLLPVGMIPVRVAMFPLRVGMFPVRVAMFPLRVGMFPVRVAMFPLRVGIFPARAVENIAMVSTAANIVALS